MVFTPTNPQKAPANLKKRDPLHSQLSRPIAAVLVAGGLLLSAAIPLRADVTLTDKQFYRQHIEKEKQKKNRTQGNSPRPAGMLTVMATGSQSLIDGSGLEWFINTNITFLTSSSASGAASEASYTHAVAASTALGGTVSTTLSDLFDGYNSIAISFNGSTGPVSTGSPSYFIYNNNGPCTIDADSGGREVVLPPRLINGIQVQRKVFVPAGDAFCRWLNIFTNTTGSPATFNLITSNNLGSDSNTLVVTTSDGDAVAETSDTWVVTMQNYSGTTSPDPRIGHVLGSENPSVGLIRNNFANGDDNPYWAYQLTLQPGETRIIMNLATGQPSKAAAQSKAAELAAAPPSIYQCMSPAEQAQIVNFGPAYFTVEFTAGPNGSLAGDTRQTIPSGGATSPVTAIPDTGYRFGDWSGSFTTTDNPLTLTYVQSNLWFQANFLNDPPQIQITSPADGTTATGLVTIAATANDDSGVERVEFFVDGIKKQNLSVNPSQNSPQRVLTGSYQFSWHSYEHTNGPHVVRATAFDRAGAQASSQITLNSLNVPVTLSATRGVERTWLSNKPFIKLDIGVTTVTGLAPAKFVIQKKTGNGGFQAIGEFLPSELQNGRYTYADILSSTTETFTYRVQAVNGSGAVIGQSPPVSI